jgi:hypothetical protein
MSLLVAACGGTEEESNQENNSSSDTTAQAPEVVEVENSDIIAPGVVGIFTMGSPVPQLPSDLSMRKAIHHQKLLGTTVEVDMQVIYNPIEDMVDLHLEENDGKEEKDLNITEMRVHSDYYRTDKGIGVHSTIEDFSFAYPDYKLWYLAESESFVGETAELPGIHFIFNFSDCTGGYKRTENSELTLDDFNPGSLIETVRVY